MIVVKLADLSDISTETTLGDVLAVDFLDNLNEVGTFSLTIANSNPQAAAIVTPNTLANLYVDGTLAFTGVFEWSETTYASTEEDHGLVTVWHGSGTLALFDRAVVAPALQLLSRPIEEDRGFNAMSSIYDESDMVAATAICTVADAQSGSWPVDWDPDFADPGADVLGPSAPASTSTAATGMNIIRQPVEFLTDGLRLVQVLADNFADMYVDGAPFMSPGQEDSTATNGFVKMSTKIEFFSAGIHSFAFRLVNVALPPANADNPTGLAFTVLETDASGAIGAVVASSAAAFALIHEYPTEMPGMSPGTIGLQVIGEAQGGTALAGPGSRADGDPLAAINLITTNFDADVDSNAVPWGIIPDYATKILTALTQVWRELATYVDFWMTPGTLAFKMVLTGTRGTVRAVDFHRPTAGPGTGNILEWTAKSEGAKSNALLIRSNVGWSDREDAAGIAAHGRIEAGVSYGADSSLEEVNRTADADLADFARERTQHTITIGPLGGDVPFDDFNVGDTVTLETVPHRVLGLGVAWEKDETNRYTIILNDGVVLDPMERVAQWLTKNVLGAIYGRSQRAQAFVPVYMPRARPLVVDDELCDTFTATDGVWTGTETDLAWNITYTVGTEFAIDTNRLTTRIDGVGFGWEAVVTSDDVTDTDDCWIEFDYEPGYSEDTNSVGDFVNVGLRVADTWDDSSPANGGTVLYLQGLFGPNSSIDPLPEFYWGAWDEDNVNFADEYVAGDPTGTWRLEAEGDAVRVYLNSVLLGSWTGGHASTGENHVGIDTGGLRWSGPPGSEPGALISRVCFGDL